MTRNTPISPRRFRQVSGWRFYLVSVALALVALFIWLRPGVAAPQNAGELWAATDAAESVLAQRNPAARPARYHLARLNQDALTQLLKQAPPQDSGRTVPLTLPLPDGMFQRFNIFAAPIMEPELATQFPAISTYAGQGVDDPTATTRLSWTPQGLTAVILSEKGSFFVEPVSPGDTLRYLAYDPADLPPDSISFHCEVNSAMQAAARYAQPRTRRTPGPNVLIQNSIRSYRLAVATTGEYAQTYGGGTVSGTMAALTTTFNVVNAIYERDLGARMVFTASQANAIFTDAASDGFTSGNPNALINEATPRLNSVIGAGNYDVGHVMDQSNLNPGGFAFSGVAFLAAVCSPDFKGGSAITLDDVQPSDALAAYGVAHEIGHKFGATHTLNTTAGGCVVFRDAPTAYEPGSGRTIMSYRFFCDTEDTRSTALNFHLASIEQIQAHLSGAGNSCATVVNTGNRAPTVNAGQDIMIPSNTPFRLEAEGFDPEGDAITYTWEQFDLGQPSPPSIDDGMRPIFNATAPSANPARTFPSLNNVLAGTTALGEVYPVTTRTLRFRVTARDNRAGGGAVSSDDVTLSVRSENGPFVVTQPANGATLNGGTMQNVAWDVTNTNVGPVNVANVRVTLSTDGGATFPYILADSTPNDGTQMLLLPNVASTTARVRVEAVGNVFFNISRSFTITTGGAATVQFNLTNSDTISEANTNGFGLTVTRTGDISAAASVDYITADGTAEQRSDYTFTSGTLNFAAGETSKTIVIPLIDDAFDETKETLRLTLSNASGATIAGASSATLFVADNDTGTPTTNPIETPQFFVRQQYFDFLNRIPDPDGFAFWTGQITSCGNDPICIRSRRITVSAAFFIELEFQESGAYVYRLYKAAFGEQTLYRPTYAQFAPDRARVVGGTELEASKLLLANNFAQRPEFVTRYPTTQTPTQFVDAILATVQQGAGVTFTAAERATFINTVTVNGRGTFLRDVADNMAFRNAVFNRAFVLMQYFGYLRRDPDDGGYNFWLSVLNQQSQNFRGMVCAFITSEEHQQRFSAIAPRSNAECVPGV